MSISVIIPSYNYAQFVARAVNSVLSQTLPAAEIIIVDDGSTDETESVIKTQIVHNTTSTKIIYLKQENKGPGAARNLGISTAKGDHLLFLDADDELKPNAIATFLEAAAKYPNAGLILSGHETASSNTANLKVHKLGKVTDNPIENAINYLNKKLSIVTGSVLFKKNVFDKLNYPERHRFNEDLILVFQALANHQVVGLQDALVVIHAHQDSQRHQPERLKMSVSDLAGIAFDEKHIPSPLSAYRKQFVAGRHLSLFRSLFIEGDYQAAKCHYHQAVKTHLPVIFKWSYLKKYCRTLLSQSAH